MMLHIFAIYSRFSLKIPFPPFPSTQTIYRMFLIISFCGSFPEALSLFTCLLGSQTGPYRSNPRILNGGTPVWCQNGCRLRWKMKDVSRDKTLVSVRQACLVCPDLIPSQYKTPSGIFMRVWHYIIYMKERWRKTFLRYFSLDAKIHEGNWIW